MAETPAEVVEEVQVLGERPGPGLWQVRRGEHTLYILGTMSPLARRMVWRSTQVEAVLERAQELVPARPSFDIKAGPLTYLRLYRQWRRERRNPGNTTLAEILPADLYARFDAARRKFAPRDRDLEDLRPLLAAGELFQAAVRSTGLTLRNDIGDAVVKMARKRGIA
ncbi:MAG: TraB/GumN family protein, partial [Steroidobacteraceae bacterium]|nr:TraB/GumN family protein [Steroidobacteraceae bacterium]